MFEIIAVFVLIATLIAVWLWKRSQPKDVTYIPDTNVVNLYQMTKPELMSLASALGLETRGMSYLTKELIILQIVEKRGY